MSPKTDRKRARRGPPQGALPVASGQDRARADERILAEGRPGIRVAVPAGPADRRHGDSDGGRPD